jgi:2',3'-cyclic-nucleotide 2'-phosphodiesterase (5'-nucleotidase family)
VNNEKIAYGAVVGLLDPVEDLYTEIPVTASSVQPSQRLEPILSQVKALTQGLLDRPITQLPEALPHNFEAESPLGNFFVDLLREEFDLDVVMINAGGIRGGLPAGDVTLSDLYKAYPFGGNLVFLSLTGEQILELLEYSLEFIGRPEMGRGFLMVSGLRFEYSQSENRPKLFVSSVRVDGEPIELDGIYEVAVEKYIFDGGDGYNHFQDWGITPERTEPRSTLSILNEIIEERGENIGGVDGRIKRR